MVPMTKSAPVLIAPTIPIARPEPVSASTRSGIAVALTASPAAETLWLTSSVEKSRFRRSGSSVGTVGCRSPQKASREGGRDARQGAWNAVSKLGV